MVFVGGLMLPLPCLDRQEREINPLKDAGNVYTRYVSTSMHLQQVSNEITFWLVYGIETHI